MSPTLQRGQQCIALGRQSGWGVDGHRLLLCMFKGNPGVLPEGATDLQVSFGVTMGVVRDGSALEEEPCWKPLLGGGVPRQLSYPERDLLPSLSVKPQREFPGDSLPMAPGTSLASSSLLTICTCVVPHKANSHGEVTARQYSSIGWQLCVLSAPLSYMW